MYNILCQFYLVLVNFSILFILNICNLFTRKNGILSFFIFVLAGECTWLMYENSFFFKCLKLFILQQWKKKIDLVFLREKLQYNLKILLTYYLWYSIFDNFLVLTFFVLLQVFYDLMRAIRDRKMEASRQTNGKNSIKKSKKRKCTIL